MARVVRWDLPATVHVVTCVEITPPRMYAIHVNDELVMRVTDEGDGVWMELPEHTPVARYASIEEAVTAAYNRVHEANQ